MMASSSDFVSVAEKDYLNTLSISELFTYLKSDPDSGNFKKVKRTLISRHDKMVKALEFHKNKCSQLMDELKEKKNEILGLEKKVEDLELDKIHTEGVISKYKEKVMELGKENVGLKFEKERAEEEIETQKRKYKELETRVANYARGFKDIINLESQVQEKSNLELVVKNVVSDEGKKDGSDQIEVIKVLDGSDQIEVIKVLDDGALLKTRDGALSCNGIVPDSSSAYSICNSPVNDSEGGLIEGQPIVNRLLNPVACVNEQTNSSSESDNANGLRIRNMGFEVKGCSSKKLDSPKLGVQRLTSGDITESVDSGDKTEAAPRESLSITIVKMVDPNDRGEGMGINHRVKQSSLLLPKRKSKPATVSGENDGADDDDQIPLRKRSVKLAKKTAVGAHHHSHSFCGS